MAKYSSISMFAMTAALAVALMCAPAMAAERTAVVSIPDMDCGSKIIQAELALDEIEGVSVIEVDSDEQTATITFDDASVTEKDMSEALYRYELTLGDVTYPEEE